MELIKNYLSIALLCLSINFQSDGREERLWAEIYRAMINQDRSDLTIIYRDLEDGEYTSLQIHSAGQVKIYTSGEKVFQEFNPDADHVHQVFSNEVEDITFDNLRPELYYRTSDDQFYEQGVLRINVTGEIISIQHTDLQENPFFAQSHFRFEYDEDGNILHVVPAHMEYNFPTYRNYYLYIRDNPDFEPIPGYSEQIPLDEY